MVFRVSVILPIEAILNITLYQQKLLYILYFCAKGDIQHIGYGNSKYLKKTDIASTSLTVQTPNF